MSVSDRFLEWLLALAGVAGVVAIGAMLGLMIQGGVP